MERFLKALAAIAKSLKSKGSFVQNFSVVFGGKSIIFLIGFLFTPIIARVFDPEAYGTFALYSSIVLNISLAIGMRIPTAFIVIHSEQRFKRVLRSMLAFLVVSTFITSLFFYFFDEFLFERVENKNLVGCWYLISGGVFLRVITGMFGNWNVREKAFKRSTIVSISESFGTKIGTLSTGLLVGSISNGLIIGEFIGKGLHVLIQLLLFVRKRIYYLIPSFSFRQFTWMMRSYREYPLFLLPSSWLSQVSNSIIIFYLSAIYDVGQVGEYSMAVGLIAIPVMLISYSSQPVLTQKIVELSKGNEPIKNQVLKFFKALVIISFPILVVGMLLGESIVALFLGEGWEVSAQLVSWMIPMVGAQFLATSVNGIFIALKKNRELLNLNIIKLSILIVVMMIAPYVASNFLELVRLIILGNFVSLIVLILLSFRSKEIHFDRGLISLFLMYLVVTALCYLQIDFFTP